jgi:tetratricopeptide (TPR) repeat protein
MRFFRVLLKILAFVLLSSCLFAQSPDLVEKSHHVKELMAEGKFKDAIPICRELVRSVPNDPGLVMNLALALDMAGNKQEAVREYQAVLKLEPDHYPALLMLGTAYLDLGQPAEAIEPLEKSLKAQPDSVDAKETLAEALLWVGRLDEAAHRFEELSLSRPNSPKTWYGLGLCYEGLAQRSFDELAKIAPGSAYWLDLVAESRLDTKQNYSAFYFYRQALAKSPSMRGVHSAIAEVYRDTGHPDWASVEEEKERQLPPPDCNVQGLECEFRAGNFDKVIEAAVGATDPEAYYWSTRAYNKLAVNAYVRLGELPPSMETHELRAKIESKRRQYAEAAKEWREALRLSPGNRYVQKQLAMALFYEGDLPSAQALFRDLLKLESDVPDLNYFLGETVLRAQKPRDAIPYLERAIKADPKMLPAHKSLGLAYLETQQAERAIPHLKEALPIDEDGSIRYQLGRAYQACGKADLAGAMFKEYQEMQSAQQTEKKVTEEEVTIVPPD